MPDTRFSCYTAAARLTPPFKACQQDTEPYISNVTSPFYVTTTRSILQDTCGTGAT